MEDRLKELLFEAAYIDSDEAVAALDANHVVQAWSSGAQTLLGVAREDIEGKSLVSLFHDEKDAVQAFEAAELQGFLGNFETRLARGDGSVERVSLSLRRLSKQAEGFIAHLSPAGDDFGEAPEQRSIRESLVRMERFSAVGRVTAAFAHEMRTPLHVISSTAELAIEDSEPKSAIREDLDMILRNAKQASSSILALLEFAKTGKAHLKEDSLNEVVASVLRWIDKLCLKQGIDLVSELSEIPNILIDSQHLRSVLHNILVNAVEAMPNGGKMVVRTAATPEGVLLSVVDTGSGMPEAVLAKATAPFFTTKEDGTGLGLYLAKRILAEHGASLDFDCPATGGTSVTVRFPALNR